MEKGFTLDEYKEKVIATGRYKWEDSEIELSNEDIEKIRSAKTKAGVQKIIGDKMIREMNK